MTQKVAAAIVSLGFLALMLFSVAVVAYEGSLLWGIFAVFIAGFISFVLTITLFAIAVNLFGKAKRFDNDKYTRSAWVLIFFSIPLNVLIIAFNIYAYLNPAHWAFG